METIPPVDQEVIIHIKRKLDDAGLLGPSEDLKKDEVAQLFELPFELR